MAHNQPDERIKSLEDQLAKIQRELRQAKAVEKEKIEKQNRRRKVIAGGIIETYALKNPKSDFAKTYAGLLKDSVSPIERVLFVDTFRALLPPDEAEALLVTGFSYTTSKPKTSEDQTSAAETDTRK